MNAILCDICKTPLDGLCLRLTARGPLQLMLGCGERDIDLCAEHAAAPLVAINAAITAREADKR